MVPGMEKSSRLETILHLCSFLVLLYSLSMIVPIFIGLLFGEGFLTSFLFTFLVAFALGVVGWQVTSRGGKTLQTRDGFMVAVLFWLIFSTISSLPLYFDNRLGLLVVGVTCLELYRTDTFGARDALVHGFFQAISIMTDNGLGAGDYPSWPTHVVLLLLGASFFGGCVGSTCGGIKAMRFLLLYRQSSREINQLVHPNGIFPTKVSGQSVSERVMQSVWSLFFCYIFFSCVFVWGLVALGHDFVTAFGTVAACINNMGVGYGDTAGGFGTLKEPAKWLMCVAMLFGRLEIFPILIVMSRTFRRF